jgi:CMP-N,N'-diacetyllegionaminic acid synthase
MYNNKKILAIIPARHGSKGLPGKNWKIMNGKPLIQWTIEQAKNSLLIDKIAISTDSEIIFNIIKNYESKKIKLIKRNKNLSLDETPMFDVIKNIIVDNNNEDYDFILLLQPTSPLRKKNDIDNFIKNLINQKNYQSSVSMSKVETWASPDHCFLIKEDNSIAKFNNNLLSVKRRQEIKKEYFFPNGSMFMSEKNSLLKQKTFYQNKTIGYKMKKWQKFDIDDIDDFIITEALLKARGKMEKRFKEWKKPDIKHNKLTEWNWMVQHPENLIIKKNVDIGAFCYINAKNNVCLEENVQIGSHCSLYTESTIDNKKGKIIIGSNTCIGSHSTIMPGIIIGKNVTIGAHSFVNKNIPDNTIAYGVPIKIKRGKSEL